MTVSFHLSPKRTEDQMAADKVVVADMRESRRHIPNKPFVPTEWGYGVHNPVGAPAVEFGSFKSLASARVARDAAIAEARARGESPYTYLWER